MIGMASKPGKCHMGGNDRNMFHRRVNDTEKKFSPEQNPRLYLLTRVISAASQLFDGNTELMAQWLNKPAKALVSRARNRLWTTSAPCPPTASHGGAGLARRLPAATQGKPVDGRDPLHHDRAGNCTDLCH